MKKQNRKIDYYLDRKIDGIYHISQAKEVALHRHKDEVEWSGQDIMCRMDPYKVRIAVSRIDSIRVWPYSI